VVDAALGERVAGDKSRVPTTDDDNVVDLRHHTY
jgi:hypothetical protein